MTYVACIGTQGSHHPLVYELGVLTLEASAGYDLAPKLRDFFVHVFRDPRRGRGRDIGHIEDDEGGPPVGGPGGCPLDG